MITVIANLKGGTGKSTVTFNLAVWLCSEKREITVIDLDPQQTLADVAAVRLEENIQPPIHVLRGPLPGVSPLRHAEETLIDVGTADLESFKQALMIADRVVIPVTPSQADIWSTQRFVQFLNKVTNGCPPESLTFINRADTNKAIMASDEAAAALTALPGLELIPQRLSDRPMFRESFSEGLAVFELEPRSVGSREFDALAMTLFGQERVTAESPRPAAAPPAATNHVEEIAAKPDTDLENEPPVPVGNIYASTPETEGKRNKRFAEDGKKTGKGKKLKKGKKEKQSREDRKGKKGKKGKKSKKGKKGK